MGMTATERLRALLTERGVEWETDRSGFRVMWGKPVDEFHDTMQFKAVDNALPNGGLNVHICGFTPEQAIAATLGSCNCSNSERTETCRAVSMRERDKRPYLHDELVCSKCGCQLAHEFGHVWQHFCPSCGRKVVDDG